ncbi:MAG: hypothetical protein PHW93_03425 [Candidatus Methanomethylophilaceae archaeon]|nr:hypothetical protein [Candidatus Methanomethylophilaceae archaeon]
MSKNKMVALALAVVLFAGLAFMVATTDLSTVGVGDTIHSTPFSGGDNITDTLNYAVFETYGPVLLVLATLMFGAIIGGVYLSKEDDLE